MQSLPVPPTQGSSGADLRELGAMIRRNRLLLAASVVIGLALGLLVAALQRPSYEATVSLLVADNPALGELDLVMPLGEKNPVGTEIELLRSRRLAAEVVDSLGMRLDVEEPRGVVRSEVLASVRVRPDAPQQALRVRSGGDRFEVSDAETGRRHGVFRAGERIAVDGLEVVLAPEAAEHEELVLRVSSRADALETLVRALKIEQTSPDGNVVQVAYRGHDPHLVRDVPNVLAERFMQMRESLQKTAARSTVDFLREQLDTLSVQLTEAEEQLRSFRESAGVVDPQLEATTRVGQLAGLQTERAALNAERAALAQLLAEVQSESRGDDPSPYRRLMAFRSLLQNQSSSSLLNSLTQLENERAALLSRRRPEDPDVQALDARITQLESQLRSIATTYLQGLANQVAAMDASLGQYQAQLDRAPAREVEFMRLSRQPQVLQEMHRLLQTRLKEAEIAQAVDDSRVRIVDVADVPGTPVNDHQKLIVGFSAVVGLLLGLGLVFVREYTDPSVRTRSDVQAAIGIPVLGMIPRADVSALPRRWARALPRPSLLLPASNGRDGRRGPDGGAAEADSGTPLLVRSDAATPLSDAYSRLHANIMYAQPDVETRILLFTSALAGDGKTTTAVNFAITLAQSGLKVLLIDADLRRGSVHRMLGGERGPGLSDLLAETPVLEGVLRTVDVGRGQRLRYIACGSGGGSPARVLGSALMRDLLQSAAQEYDRVIIDTPPVNLFPDAAVLAGSVDGAVVVARTGVTPFDALVDTAEQLSRTHAPVIGAVLNGIDFTRDAAYDRSLRWYSQRDAYGVEEADSAAV